MSRLKNNSAQSDLIISLAADARQAVKDAAAAPVKAEQAAGAAGVANTNIEWLKKDNERLEKRIADNDTAYTMKIDALNAEINALKQRVEELMGIVRSKNAEIDALKAVKPDAQ